MNSNVTTPPHYLWDTYIPYGHLSCLCGEFNIGKSALLQDWAGRVLSDQPMPDGQSATRRDGPILLIDADGHMDIWKQRMRWWEQSLQGLIVIPAEWLDLARQSEQKKLLAWMTTYQPDWVIVDSLETASNRLQARKKLLTFLNQVAQNYDCALTLTTRPHSHTRSLKAVLPQHTFSFQIDDNQRKLKHPFISTANLTYTFERQQPDGFVIDYLCPTRTVSQ